MKCGRNLVVACANKKRINFVVVATKKKVATILKRVGSVAATEYTIVQGFDTSQSFFSPFALESPVLNAPQRVHL